jgi:hypothetical protein
MKRRPEEKYKDYLDNPDPSTTKKVIKQLRPSTGSM